MPDAVRLIEALCASAAVAALVLLVCRRRGASVDWTSAGWILGVVGGFYVGCRIIGLWPHWPPREDQDRLLLILLPAVAITEIIATCTRAPRGLVFTLWLLVAGATTRVLLAETHYISHAAGPNSRLWSTAEVWLILGGLALALAAVWWALVVLGRRAADFSLPLCLAIACGGTGLTVMLSGYMSGGLLGLPFAAALFGATLSTLALAKPLALSGPIGVSMVMTFSLLIMGRFFGELTTIHAALLWAAPLAAWLAELLPRSAGGIARSWLRVLAVSAVVGTVVASAALKALPGPKSQGDERPGVEDYYR